LALVWSVTIVFAAGFLVRSSEAQTRSDQNSDRVMRERIATIFQETLKRGEFRVMDNAGSPVKVSMFFPPTTEHVDEIRKFGDAAIPILAEYLDSSIGFEKYLALRFLGSIGGKGIIEPLRRVVSDDPSPSFRSSAVRWLSLAPWDLAAPIIRQAAENDSSDEVRSEAKYILAHH